MELSIVHISIVLSMVCMGVVFVGGWYLQSLLMEEQYNNMEQPGQIEKVNKIVIGQTNRLVINSHSYLYTL